MSSVTSRIRQIKQPRGGYIKPSTMRAVELKDRKVLNEHENVHYSIIGLVVDYMTRFRMGANVNDAFSISIRGACIAGRLSEIEGYLKKIKSLSDVSIINACKAATFDVWYRNFFAAMLAKGASETNPDKKTIHNIKILVERCVKFWKKYGPVKVQGFTFEKKGYTDVVDAGDGDFLTKDTLWDIKVSKSKPSSNNTLQLLMYYIMGKHSKKPEFTKIKKIGIFNPKLKTVYLLDVKDIPKSTIKTVEKDVICYK